MLRNWFPRQAAGRPAARRPRVAPNLVQLEDRATPATFYVDPSFPGAGTATFNAGKPNEVPGVAIGTAGFASLADAIAAANGAAGADTILLSDGTHSLDPSAATVLVTDALTISGRDKSFVTVRNAGDTTAASGPDGAILRAESTKLNISGLTFDGNGTAPGNFLAGTGVWFDKSSGTVTNSTFTGVMDDSDPANNRGSGVVVNGAGAVVVVENSKFTNLGRNGVFFYAGGTGAVRNSVLEGRAAALISVGVNVGEGSEAVLVTGNTFTGFDGTSGTNASLGVLVTDNPDADGNANGNFQDEPSSAVIVGNSFSGNEYSIGVGQDAATDKSTAVIQYNSFADPEILADTKSKIVGTFNYYGTPTGPAAGSGNVDGANAGTGVIVPDNYNYLATGANPNNGILIAPPGVYGVPYTPGLSLDDLTKAAATSYVADTKFDNISPTLTPTSSAGALPVTFGPGGLPVTITFSEAVTGFDGSDLILAGGKATAVTNPSGDNKTFVLTVTAAADGPVTLAVAAGAATDANGNASAALGVTALGTADTTPPTATFSAPTGTLPVTFGSTGGGVTVTFSEAVSGLTASDFVVNGTAVAGKVVSVTPAGPTNVYTVQLSAGGTGSITLALAAGAATDAVGNPSVAVPATLVANADFARPSVTITSPAGALPVAFNDPLNFTFTFSEAVTGFTASDVKVAGTTGGGSVLSVTPAADGKTYSVAVGGFTTKGDVTLALPAGSVTDLVGNDNLPAGPITVATVDATRPTAVIDSPSATLPIPFGDPLTFRVTFSEAVTGFTTADVTFTGSATGGVVSKVVPADIVTPDDKTFFVTIDSFTGPGDVTVSIADGAASDAAGNTSVAVGPVAVATGPVVPPDTTPPTVTVAVTGGQFVNPLTFIATFSEPVTGFDAGDIVLGGTAAGGTVSKVVADAAGKTYTVTVDGFTARGTVTVAIPAGAASDEAGNPSKASAVTSAGEFAPAFSRGFAAGGDAGISQPFYLSDENFKLSNGIVPFETSFTGGLRVATADVNGDGTLDIVVGAGVGRANEVVVYDGAKQGTVLFRFNPFETTFTAGVFVHAADLNGDGKAEVIVSPDEGGGPRVSVYDGAGIAAGSKNVLADFFGIDDPNFRGGARVGSGDLDGDGTPDLLVAAGFGGGPRVAVFDGTDILAGKQTRLVGDFFGYEPELRNGVYIAGGDLDGDGKAEIILGAGPGGGPRVRVLSGASLLASNTQTEVANFFGGNDANRGGIRVAATDLDGDGKIDIVTGPGSGGGSKVSVYYGKDIPAAGTPALGKELALFGDFANGVYVG